MTSHVHWDYLHYKCHLVTVVLRWNAECFAMRLIFYIMCWLLAPQCRYSMQYNNRDCSQDQITLISVASCVERSMFIAPSCPILYSLEFHKDPSRFQNHRGSKLAVWDCKLWILIECMSWICSASTSIHGEPMDKRLVPHWPAMNSCCLSALIGADRQCVPILETKFETKNVYLMNFCCIQPLL